MGQTIASITTNGEHELKKLGEQLRKLRRALGLTAVDAARAAGISRVTLHRAEKGEMSVSAGAYMSIALALGSTIGLLGQDARETDALPERVCIDDFPELRKLGWQVKAGTQLSPLEAWDIYTRNWRHLEQESLTEAEAALIVGLRNKFEAARV